MLPLLSPAFLKTVSQGPGVYQLFGDTGVLYVGKAANLRRRLAQHAQHSGLGRSKTAVMLAQARRVETILTATEKEALLLEAVLIKRHRPKYNVVLRDDKQYPLIKVTVNEAWPRIVVTRRRQQDGSRWFGPYVSAPALRETLSLLNTLFPLRRCRRLEQRRRPCLNYQLRRCLAPCAGLADPAVYQGLVEEVLLLLEGRSRQVLVRLEAEMRAAAARLAFEEAARCRDRLASLSATLERQSVAAEPDCDQDVFGCVRQEAAAGIAVLAVRGGLISGARTFLIADPLGQDGQILREALLQLYAEDNPPPREILLPVMAEDQELVAERLAELRQGPVRLHAPRRGEKLRRLRLAAENAAAVLAAQAQPGAAWEEVARALRQHLGLRRLPEAVACLDISNLMGKQAVGALVCFVRGEQDAARCARFPILLKDEPDDCAMMAEALRRQAAVWQAQESWPDLLLLDGGKGQLGAARRVLDEPALHGRTELAALAKEKGEEGERLFLPGRQDPVLLPRHSPALLCLMRIRDEAHRFGITLHRRLRSQAALRSELDSLPGVGLARRQQLLKALGSLEGIKAASLEELAAVPGIGRRLAQGIWARLHPAAPPDAERKPF